jgi:hypothetical protein
MRLPEHAAGDEGHDEKRGADNALIGAVDKRFGNRKALFVERADDAVFAVNGMRGRQKFSRRLSPQHIAPQRRFDQISRIGLAALELTDDDRTGEAGKLLSQIGFQPRYIEPQPLGHFAGAGKRALTFTTNHVPALKKSSKAHAVACGFSSGT